MSAWKADTLFVICCCVAQVMIGALVFPGAGTDDCFITYQAVDRLLDVGRIENLNGERVEISSSLLLVLALAGLRSVLPGSTFWIGLVLSVSLGCGVTVSTWWLSKLVFGSRIVAQIATLAAATHTPLMYWAWSGMETTFAACCLAIFLGLAALGSRDRTVVSTIWWVVAFSTSGGAVFLVRPEGFVVVGVVGCWLLWSLRTGRPDDIGSTQCRCGWIATLLLALVMVGITTWRWLSFGRLMPNPVYAKTSGITFEGVRSGARYLVDGLLTPSLLVVVALPIAISIVIGIRVFLRENTPLADGNGRSLARLLGRLGSTPVALLAVTASAYLGVVLSSGGDWMPNHRFIIHVLPPVLALGSGALWSLFSSVGGRRSIDDRLLPNLLLVLVVAASLSDRAWLVPLRESRCLWDFQRHPDRSVTTDFQWLNAGNRRDLDLLLPALTTAVARSICYKGKSVLVTGQMGYVPYMLAQRFPGRVAFVDRRGITDPTLTRLAGIDRRPWGLEIGFLDLASVDPAGGPMNDLERAVRYVWGYEPDIIYGLSYSPGDFREMVRLLWMRGFRVNQLADVRDAIPHRDTHGEHVFVISRDLGPQLLTSSLQVLESKPLNLQRRCDNTCNMIQGVSRLRSHGFWHAIGIVLARVRSTFHCRLGIVTSCVGPSPSRWAELEMSVSRCHARRVSAGRRTRTVNVATRRRFSSTPNRWRRLGCTRVDRSCLFVEHRSGRVDQG